MDRGILMKMRTVFAGSALAAAACMIAPTAAHAEVVGLVPAATTYTTDDGAAIELHLEGAWNKMDTANLTGTSREGQGDFRAWARVHGATVKGAQLQIGVLFGCFANLNMIAPSAQVQVGPQLSVEPSFPIPIVPRGSFGASVQAGGSVQISPGTINATAVSQRSLEALFGEVRVRGVHLNIDSCLGPATVQVYASLGTATQLVTDSATVYSQRIFI